LQLALLLTIGKYVFVALVYVFAFVVYRGMMAELARKEATHPVRSRVRVRSRTSERAAPAPAPAQHPPVAPSEAVATQPVASAAAPVAAAPEPVPAAPEAPARPRLMVVKVSEENAGLGSEIELSAAATIGRGPENTITLNDRYVSGNHGQVYLREGRRLLLDRGSTNGTLLNGRPVEGEVPINDRDQITIGTTIFEYRE